MEGNPTPKNFSKAEEYKRLLYLVTEKGELELADLDSALESESITEEQHALLLRSLIKRQELIEDGLSGVANRREEEKNKLSIDTVTGLEKESAYRETVERLMAELNHEPPRRNPPLAAVMIIALDMTGLRALNNAYDHDTGSRALKAFADHLKTLVRADTDRVFRRGDGADEFAIVMPVYSNEMDFDYHFKKIQKAVNENLFLKVGENDEIDFQLTAAMGYAVARAGENTTAEALRIKADQNERADHARRDQERILKEQAQNK